LPSAGAAFETALLLLFPSAVAIIFFSYVGEAAISSSNEESLFFS
jgi:hypothetical protein